jgi:hypothetical protein
VQINTLFFSGFSGKKAMNKQKKPLTFKGKKLPSGFTYPIKNTPTV